MIKPPSLKPGSHIGLISPSFWLNKKELAGTSKFFRDHGYKLKFGKSNSLKWGPFAGTPQERADDIHRMFSDPEIDAIICVRGGYGANRVLPLIDYQLIGENPKIFIGFSDITAYNISITQKTGLVTFHGPMLVSYKKQFIRYNFSLMEHILTAKKRVKIEYPEKLSPKVLKPGVANGPLWGGNITLILNRLGTTEQLNTNNVILFLEDVDEYLYSFERMLVQMRTTGILDNIKGLIIGELVDFKDQDIPFERDTDEIIMDICGDLDIPIISNFPCGHGTYQATLPISIPIELNAKTNTPYISLLESAVEENH
ncbi:MAG: LD-carboxypeptidase [Candidatus Marinimicrobia bacterium]|nr:LD-carboxypeptidase [Candidatus Neomarinimicrobiota bacterium]|tara:strand:- start:13354 stop:14292 length:939 start_codon:yes stop_codon:yes gene_type:complete